MRRRWSEVGGGLEPEGGGHWIRRGGRGRVGGTGGEEAQVGWRGRWIGTGGWESVFVLDAHWEPGSGATGSTLAGFVQISRDVRLRRVQSRKR